MYALFFQRVVNSNVKVLFLLEKKHELYTPTLEVCVILELAPCLKVEMAKKDMSTSCIDVPTVSPTAPPTSASSAPTPI